MSAVVLREAAAAMRARTEAAMASLPDSVPEWHSVAALMGDGKTREDARHIASWHPAVALAVADWLDVEADACGTRDASDVAPHALAVATAYLGTTPT